MKNARLFMISAVLAFSLSGCRTAEPEMTEPSSEPVTTAASSAPEKEETIPEKLSYNDEWIDEAIAEDGEYKNEAGTDLSYSFHIPKIRSASPNARLLNEQIYTETGLYAEALLASLRDGAPVSNDHISWKSYWKDSLLTLVIRIGQERDMGHYFCYHYDFSDDTIPDNARIIEKLGFSQDSFMDSVRQAVMTQYDLLYAGMPTGNWYGQAYYGNIMGMRSQTLREVTADKVMICPYNGGCTIISRYYTLEDSADVCNGWSYRSCELNADPASPSPEKRISDGRITAILRNDELYLKFHDNELISDAVNDPHQVFPGNHLMPDTEYRVNGLYSDYSDVALCSIGKENHPYAVLITEQGTVEMVNVLDSLKYGRPCAFPAYGLSGIEELVNDPEQNIIYAQDQEGNRYDLSQWTESVSASIPGPVKDGRRYISDPISHESDDSGGYDRTYALSFGDNKEHSLLFEDSGPDHGPLSSYEGNYHLLGMEDDGLVYYYRLKSPEREIAGTFLVRHLWEEDLLSYHEDAIEVISGSGPDLFDQNGSWILFRPEI